MVLITLIFFQHTGCDILFFQLTDIDTKALLCPQSVRMSTLDVWLVDVSDCYGLR